MLSVFVCFLLAVSPIIHGKDFASPERPTDELSHLTLEQSFERNQRSRKLQQEESEGCTLEAEQVSQWYDEATQTWTLNDEVLSTVESNLQRIVDCASSDDVLSFEATTVIQPSSEITLTKNLNFRGSENNKARITCPAREGLFQISDSEVQLQNIIIQDCTQRELEGNRSVILTNGCSSSVALRGVDFVRNEQVASPSFLTMEPRGCGAVSFEDVKIENNRCTGRCMSLTGDVSLQDIMMTGTTGGLRSVSSVVAVVGGTNLEVNRMRSADNELAAIQIVESSFDVKNSQFINHNMVFPEGTRVPGGVFYMARSEGSITGCTFERNNNPIGESGALYLVAEATATIEDTEFLENVARDMGGAISMHVGCSLALNSVRFFKNSARNSGALNLFTANVTGRNVHFEENSAELGGGGVGFSQGSTFLCTDCSFRGNSAGDEGGGAIRGYPGSSPPRYAAQLEDTEFISNTAVYGGAVFFQGRRFTTDFAFNSIDDLLPFYVLLNCTFTNNNAAFDGGAVFAQDPPSIRLGCTPREIPQEDKLEFIPVEEFEQLEIAEEGQACDTWSGNTAAEGTYGQNIASWAQQLLVSLSGEEPDGSEMLRIDGIRAGENLPSIDVLAADHNGNGPAFFLAPISNQVTMASVDNVIDEQVVSMEIGRATFSEIVIRGDTSPGVYDLTIIPDVSNAPVANFTVEIVA